MNGLLKQDFNVIENYFEKLNYDDSHFENSNDICTPIGCVKEMVDKIPEEFWQRKNIKVLDSCCGNGNFFAYISKKTELNNLYFNEINEKRITNVKKIFGENINLTNKDFLSFENKEEFDLVVSNPPYAKFNNGLRVSKNHNLSREFILKSLHITKKDGYILFIVPNNWMSFSDRNILPKELSKYQFIHLNIHRAKKWFPKVGSSFTWFLLNKIENKNSFTIDNGYIIKDTQQVYLDNDIDFIPLYYNKIVKSILNKVVKNKNKKYRVETTSFLHRYTKSKYLSTTKNEEYQYKIIHTPSQTLYSKIQHKWQNGYKVFLSLSNQYGTFIDNCGMTQSVAFVRCKNLKEAKKIKKELDNPVYRFVNNLTRYGNFNNIRVLQNFSKLDTFQLTEQESNFVHEFNAKYYEKKK